MVATPIRPKAQLAPKPEIVWEKLPEDFVLPDDPVDNINQPALAAALTDSLFLAGYLSQLAATTTNYGICAKVDGKTVVKAPDWAWIPAIAVPKAEVERSYTPVLEGDLPIVVMEFLSEAEGTEYSIKPTYPPGKWFYYERVLKVPNYVIFHPQNGTIEFYQLSEVGLYEPQVPDQDGLYWLAEANLFLGAWEGAHQDRAGWWLRWWNADREMLLWGEELTEQERQRAEQERQRADQAEQALEKAEQGKQTAIARLLTLGLSPEQIADTLSISVTDIPERP
ncbi:MAG: putative restriction endonuclease [Phormidesmis priestleyi Ana]|uniref:Putative restriction endonuclease n=1 Tax=Phormidesmis priestleyi Ana TaxID=1666911 RepID=A0A0P7Z1G7_9CYAN|nr:MAG: putative restriction endonuclease [Phormidesmis priestleyi Ana]